MNRIKIIEDADQKLVCVHCPGCGMLHPFRVRGAGPIWTWNESEESPTFSPSMLVNKSYPDSRCHSFVESGQIRFLGDCHHDLKNETHDLPNLDEHGEVLKKQ